MTIHFHQLKSLWDQSLGSDADMGQWSLLPGVEKLFRHQGFSSSEEALGALLDVREELAARGGSKGGISAFEQELAQTIGFHAQKISGVAMEVFSALPIQTALLSADQQGTQTSLVSPSVHIPPAQGTDFKRKFPSPCPNGIERKKRCSTPQLVDLFVLPSGELSEEGKAAVSGNPEFILNLLSRTIKTASTDKKLIYTKAFHKMIDCAYGPEVAMQPPHEMLHVKRPCLPFGNQSKAPCEFVYDENSIERKRCMVPPNRL